MPTKDFHTEKFTKGSRTFFFDVKKDSTGGLYLKISCSEKSNAGFEHHRVIVFEEDLLEFVYAVKKSTAEIQKLKQYPPTTQKLRKVKRQGHFPYDSNFKQTL